MSPATLRKVREALEWLLETVEDQRLRIDGIMQGCADRGIDGTTPALLLIARLEMELERLRGPIRTSEAVDWSLSSAEIDQQFRALVIENARLTAAVASLAGTAPAAGPRPTDSAETPTPTGRSR
jgi:hypothetical protein